MAPSARGAALEEMPLEVRSVDEIHPQASQGLRRPEPGSLAELLRLPVPVEGTREDHQDVSREDLASGSTRLQNVSQQSSRASPGEHLSPVEEVPLVVPPKRGGPTRALYESGPLERRSSLFVRTRSRNLDGVSDICDRSTLSSVEVTQGCVTLVKTLSPSRDEYR